ncbi:MAG: TetR/AcrR family transcriptional regulator [Candidatus Moranbacteria bacterium]|nr:TetR/AcrR family transcriptional regulator [Candidatus Moranbacteria bacterium]
MNATVNKSKDIVQDTKKYIVNTARELFSEFTYLGVSMDDIAKKLNIAKASIYYHFTGKVEIYEKVLDEVFDDLKLVIINASREVEIDKRMHKLIKNYLDFGFREKNLIKSMVIKLSPADAQITNHIAGLRNQISNLIQPIIEDFIKSKDLENRADSHLLASMLTSMMDGLLLDYSFLNKKMNPEKVANQIVVILFSNLAN